MTTNLYGTILWQMETYFVNEKQEIHTIYRPVSIKKMIDGTLQVVWACTKENIFNLFDILKKRWQYYIHVRLDYRCVKICMATI